MDGAGVFFLFVIFFIIIWAVTLRGCGRKRAIIVRENMQYYYPTEGNGMAMF